MADHAQQGPVTGLTPHLSVGHGHATQAVDFYIAAFAAKEMMRMPAEDGKRLMHCHLHINGGSLMLCDDFPEQHGGSYAPPAAVTLHLQVDDVDAWYARAVAAGAVPRMPPEDMFWGDRYAQVDDPFGFTWSLGASPPQ